MFINERKPRSSLLPKCAYREENIPDDMTHPSHLRSSFPLLKKKHKPIACIEARSRNIIAIRLPYVQFKMERKKDAILALVRQCSLPDDTLRTMHFAHLLKV